MKLQTIFRRAHESEFVVVGNDLARNGTLSHRSRGILLWLLSYPPDWEIRIEDLITENDGIAAVRVSVQELEDAGYVVRDQGRQERGRFYAGTFQVYETPVPEEQRSGADRRARAAARAAQDSPHTELPHTVKQQAVPPYTDSPHTVPPHTANRTHQIQSLQKTDLSKETAAAVARVRAHEDAEKDPAERPPAYGAWERVGGPLTQHITGFLSEAVTEYGEAFVLAAITEMGDSAVGAVSVKYLRRILEDCRREGRMPGETRSARPAARPRAAAGGSGSETRAQKVTASELAALRRQREES